MVERHNRDIFLIFYNIWVRTHNIPFNVKKKMILNYPKHINICSYDIFSQGLKNEFSIAMVNEPLVFEPLKFYSIVNTRLR